MFLNTTSISWSEPSTSNLYSVLPASMTFWSSLANVFSRVSVGLLRQAISEMEHLELSLLVQTKLDDFRPSNLWHKLLWLPQLPLGSSCQVCFVATNQERWFHREGHKPWELCRNHEAQILLNRMQFQPVDLSTYVGSAGSSSMTWTWDMSSPWPPSTKARGSTWEAHASLKSNRCGTLWKEMLVK